MNLHESGIYKKRLYNILLPAGISMLLLLSLLLGYSLENQSKHNYIHYLTDAVSSLESNSRITMTIISRTISDALRNSQLSSWAHASDKNSYYYTAIAAQKQLQIITTDSSFINYDLAITTVTPKTFDEETLQLVLKKTGSSTVDDYFIHEKKLLKEEMNQIFLHFSQSQEPVVIPHYEDDTLSSIYYLTKSNLPEANLLFFITIPADVLAGNSGTSRFLLYESEKALAYSSSSPEAVAYFDQLHHVLEAEKQQKQDPFKYQGNYISISDIPFMGWKVAYVNDGFAPPVSQIILFLMFALALMGVSLYAILKLVESLYRPVGEAVVAAMEDSAPLELKGPIDEFKLIRQNCEKIQHLGKALNEALYANNQLASQRYLRDILYASSSGKPCPSSLNLPEADYRIALFEFSNSAGDAMPNEIMLQKELMHNYTVNESDVIYVDMENHYSALILRDPFHEELIPYLQSLLTRLNRESENHINQRIALSNMQRGTSRLCLGYQEALRILEYKHLYTESAILTYQQIAVVDAVTYSYPLSTENRLVHYVLDGSDEALVLFDQLIRTNLLGKTLSIESIQSFVYALIGTIGRIYQELKTSPEELLSEKIDFKYWYDHWSESVIITQIRQSLQDTLAAVHRKSNHSDQILLDQMLDFIHHNYADDIMLNDMADRFIISPKYCGILFKQLKGNNFKDYLNRYRMEKAKEILEHTPEIKITDLSALVGFNSANSFIRVFRKYTGISPKAYAEQQNT